MARKQVSLTIGFAWLLLATAALGQQQLDNPFGQPQLFPRVNRDLIDDTQQGNPVDENPFGGDTTKDGEVDDDPFGAPTKQPQAATDKKTKVRIAAKTERPASSNQRVREALKSPARMEFTEMPLADAVAYLKDYHGIEIQLDLHRLEDAGVGSDTPVNLNVNGIPLSSALRLLLDDFDLTYVVTNDVLLITTEDAADSMTELKVYDVTEVIGPEAKAEEVAAMLSAIKSPMHTIVPGGLGGGMGGMGGGMVQETQASHLRIIPFRNLLIVQASQREHEEFSELFEQIKAKLKAGN